MITYRTGNDLDIDAVIELYRDSTLGARRPVDERARMVQMYARANLVVSAWDGELIVGVSRSLSDFCYATYLSDLAVRLAYQKHGIGRELVRITQAEGGRANVVLLSAPAAVDYYPKVGFAPAPGFILRDGEPVR